MSQLFGTSTYLLMRQAQQWNAATWKKLDAILPITSPTCWPIICLEGAFERGNPKLASYISKIKSLALAKKRKWVFQDKGITETNIHEYIHKEASEHYKHIPPKILQTVALQVPFNAKAIENELTKLELFYSDTKHAKDKDALLAKDRNQELNYFGVVRLILDGRIDQVCKAILTNDDTDKNFFLLQVFLERDLRAIWQLKTGFLQNANPYSLRNWQKVASYARLQDIALAMSVLVEAEWRLKSGLSTVEQCLDYMYVTLCTIFANAKRR